ISLHGMEEALGITYNKKGVKDKIPYVLVRYADDFLILSKSEQLAEKAKEIISSWLSERGLKLSASKTKIRHIEEGVDFLGVNIRRRSTEGKKCGKLLLMTPSKQAQQSFRDKMRKLWKEVTNKPLHCAIRELNSRILGWGSYYRYYVSKVIFTSMDNWMWKRQVRYRYKRHPHKSWKWCYSRYWGKIPGREGIWTFRDPKTGQYLYKMSWIPIERQQMVKGRNSPDNPELRAYWIQRQAYKKVYGGKLRSKLWYKQRGLCEVCQGEL
ncbi:group II intron reverse transcriptase/maturase, partial [Rhizobium leguminosarum]|nr:group II intron reverse transcriptase/maturase [Rhizobium leguminosarum]